MDSYQREVEKARKEFEHLEVEHRQMLFGADGVKSENNYHKSDLASGKMDKKSESNNNVNRGQLEYIDNQAIITNEKGLIDY